MEADSLMYVRWTGKYSKFINCVLFTNAPVSDLVVIDIVHVERNCYIMHGIITDGLEKGILLGLEMLIIHAHESRANPYILT